MGKQLRRGQKSKEFDPARLPMPPLPWEGRGKEGAGGQVPPARVINVARRRGLVLRFLKLVAFCLIVGAIASSCVGATLFVKHSRGLPSFASIEQYRPPLPSMMFAADGQLIARLAKQRRELVPLKKIPIRLLQAFVAAEDDQFYRHAGVDPFGILRAVVKNLRHGRIKAGGSTLTQQVAKSFLVDRLVVTLRPNTCRNDSQCGWRERCKPRPRSALGVCTPRSFGACGREVTIIHLGKPVRIWRGYNTLCDPHEACHGQCKDRQAITGGMCKHWRCEPTAPRPVCHTDTACGFGQRCKEGECRPQFTAQVQDLAAKIRAAGAEMVKVSGPAEVLALFPGRTPAKVRSKRIRLAARHASRVDPRDLENLPAVRAVYRFAEKSFRRKIREAILALRLERRFKKNEILWLYMTQVYLGHRAYGVQAAAKVYFGRNVWDLSLAQMAVIAGLPKAPTRYDPYRSPKNARTRQRYVLRRMMESGFITRPQMEEALKEELKPRPSEGVFRKKVPYFAGEVKRRMIKRHGRRKLLEGGLTILTTASIHRQDVARRALKQGLERLDRRQGFRGPLKELAGPLRAAFLTKARKSYDGKPLLPGKLYAGLVERIDRKQHLARVRIGSRLAALPLAGMRWARVPRPSSYFMRHLLTRIGDRIRVGDVLMVEPVKGWRELRTKVWAVDRKIPRAGLLVRLRQWPKVQGAILSMDPDSGYVDVMVGGYDYRRSEFNRAMDACRQPGSSFKPIVYSTALEFGEEVKKKGKTKKQREPVTVSTVLIDAPLVHDAADGESARYKPRNYTGSYEGEVPVRRALMSSMNIPASKLMIRVGVEKVIEQARRFGITTQLRKELGLALGQSCVKPWQLFQAYAAISRGGTRARPVVIKVVADRDGKVIEDRRSHSDPDLSPAARIARLEARLYQPEERILSKEASYLMTYLLSQVCSGGTGARASRLKRPVAGKTGTTNDSFDVWFVGFTPRQVASVWMGFDKNEVPLGRSETGGKTALPVWLQFMQTVNKGEKWNAWRPPRDIVWKRVDYRTGKVVPKGSRGIKVPFMKGTEPKVEAGRGQTRPGDFYKQDY